MMADEFTVRANINAKDNASGVFNKFSKAVSKSLKLAAVAAVAAAVTFGAASLKWGMDFEAQMSSVEAVTRASVAEMQEMTTLAEKLGRDSAFSAKEAGEAMEFLAMAGFDTNEILTATADTLNLAAAGSLALGQAADIASNVLTGFNLPAAEMGRVSDVMAEAAASANTNIVQMGEAMSYVAPFASAAGWSLEEVTAAIGFLGNAGIQGSRAGTVLKAAISGLTKPSDAARKAMTALGMSVVDSDGKLMSLEEILKQIDPAAIESAKGLGYMTEIFGKRGAPGLIAMVKQGADNFGEFKRKLDDSTGAAATMALTKLDNLKGAFTLLKSSVQGIGIALTTGEGGLTSILQGFITDSLIPTINAMALWVGTIGGIPGMIKIAGEVIIAFKNEVVTALTNLFTDWEIFKGFVLGMAEAFGLVILSLGVFGESLLSGMVEIAKVIWLPFVAPLTVLISQIKELFIEMINWLAPEFIAFANKLLTPIRGVLGKLGIEIGEFDWTPLTTQPALDMAETWEASWAEVGEGFVAAKDDVVLGISAMTEGFGLAGQSAVDAVAIANPELVSFGDQVDAIVEKQVVSTAEAKALGAATEEAVGVASGALEDYADNDLSEGSSLWNALENTAGKIASSMAVGWQNYIDTLPSLAESIGEGMTTIGNSINTAMSDAFHRLITTGKIDLKTGFKAIGDAAARALADALSAKVMKALIDPAISAVISSFSVLGSAMAAAAVTALIAWAPLIAVLYAAYEIAKALGLIKEKKKKIYEDPYALDSAETLPREFEVNNETPFMQRGGIVPGIFNSLVPIIAHAGEEVITRSDPRHSAYNNEEAFGTTIYNFTINALDGADVERVLTEKIIPALKRRSQSGEDIMYEGGLITKGAL